MGSFKADQPRANPPICWNCDRKLHGNGKFYVMVDGHPYHKGCAPEHPQDSQPSDAERGPKT